MHRRARSILRGEQGLSMILVLCIGALFVALFFAAGYFVGAFQNKTELIKGWINRLFPPKGE